MNKQQLDLKMYFLIPHTNTRSVSPGVCYEETELCYLEWNSDTGKLGGIILNCVFCEPIRKETYFFLIQTEKNVRRMFGSHFLDMANCGLHSSLASRLVFTGDWSGYLEEDNSS